MMVVLINTVLLVAIGPIHPITLCGWGRELGHCLRSLRHCVFSELSGEEKAHCGLDLSGRKCWFLVVSWQLWCLSGESVEDVVDERVQDWHASLRDASAGVDLLQDSVDVGRVWFDSFRASLPAGTCCLLWDLCRLFSNCWCFCHCSIVVWLLINLCLSHRRDGEKEKGEGFDSKVIFYFPFSFLKNLQPKIKLIWSKKQAWFRNLFYFQFFRFSVVLKVPAKLPIN